MTPKQLFLLSLGVALLLGCQRSPEATTRSDPARIGTQALPRVETGQPRSALYEAQLAQHEAAWAAAARFSAVKKVQVNVQEEWLHEIRFAEALGDIDGELTVPIPPDIIRAWPAFLSLTIRGEGFEDVRVSPLGFRSEGEGRLSHHTATRVDSRLRRFRVRQDRVDGYGLRVQGWGRIDSVALVHARGIPPTFDDAPFRTWGADRPVRDVTVRFDPSLRRSIGGASELDRLKYFRLHTPPDWVFTDAMRDLMAETRLVGGRGMWNWVGEHRDLQEDPMRPGHALLEDLAEPPPSELPEPKAPWDVPWLLSVGRAPGLFGEKGHPKATARTVHYAGVGELAALRLRQRWESGQGPAYFEVSNESDIKKNWDYHWGGDAWEKLCDYHIAVAREVKRVVPQVLVGGPTAAWPQVARNDFSSFDPYKVFIPRTQDDLDFYSLHIYEKDGLSSFDEQARSTWCQGKLEATLDLFDNYQLTTIGHRKPYIISEYGNLSPRLDAFGHWARLRCYNTYLMVLMERPDRLLLTIPFLLTHAPWDDDYAYTLFSKNEQGRYEETPLVDFARLWRDYDGVRVPSSGPDWRVRTHAVREANTVRIAINNVHGQRLRVRLQNLAPGCEITKVTVSRLYFDRGEIRFVKDRQVPAAAPLNLAVEETCIVNMVFKDLPAWAGTLREDTYFGDRTIARSEGVPLRFEIKAPASEQPLETASLRVGVGRDGGFSEAIRIRLNDVDYSVGMPGSSGVKDFFGFAQVSVPASALRERNTVTVSLPGEGGTVASVALTTVRREEALNATP